MIPEHTGSRATRIVGLLTLIGLASVLFLGLLVTAPDDIQGDAARLIYVNVPVAIVMNVGFFVTAFGRAMWLWKKSRWGDTLAIASAEIGVISTALALGSGMIWGRPTWG